jgi:hypothetical protein
MGCLPFTVCVPALRGGRLNSLPVVLRRQFTSLMFCFVAADITAGHRPLRADALRLPRPGETRSAVAVVEIVLCLLCCCDASALQPSPVDQASNLCFINAFLCSSFLGLRASLPASCCGSVARSPRRRANRRAAASGRSIGYENHSPVFRPRLASVVVASGFEDRFVSLVFLETCADVPAALFCARHSPRTSG